VSGMPSTVPLCALACKRYVLAGGRVPRPTGLTRCPVVLR
jgi:hypothetical protein